MNTVAGHLADNYDAAANTKNDNNGRAILAIQSHTGSGAMIRSHDLSSCGGFESCVRI